MKQSHKYIVTLSILLALGYAWSLDMPQAIQVPIRQDPYNFSNFEFNFLYFATYSAIFLSDIPVGMLLDKYPIKNTVLCIAAISLFSQVGILFTFYLRFPGYKVVLYILRGIFGITGEGLFTVQALLISLYGGRYYDRLLGFGVCIPFFFNSINNVLTPFMYDRTYSLELVWTVGILFCAITLGSGVAVSKLVADQEKEKLSIKQQEEKAQQEQEPMSFGALKEMPRQFWVIVGGVFFTEIVLGCYMDNLNDTIVKRFNIPYVNAGYMLFIPYGVGFFIAYILGLIVEKEPKSRRVLMFASTCLYTIGLLCVYLLPNIDSSEETPIFHYLVIIFQFLTVSLLLSMLYGILSSSIVYVVNPKHLGIAWGVIGSAFGLSEASSPLVIAWILETEQFLSDGYKKLTLFIFFASLFALCFSLWILLGNFEKIDVNSSQLIKAQKGISEFEEQEDSDFDDSEQK